MMLSSQVLILACAAPLAAQEIVLDLDPAQAKVKFTLAAILHTVHGSFKLRRSTIHFDTVSGKITGEVVADAASGMSGDPSRDRRMHKDILESERYPEIVFAPDSVEGAIASEGVSQVQVHGTFRIHGAAHEITIPVAVTRAGARINVRTRFAIPYVKWGMRNPSTLLLRVSDKVEIEAAAGALP